MTKPAQKDRETLPPFHPHRALVMIERHEQGGLILSSPHLPGLRIACRGPVGLAEAVERIWTENAVRAYANGKGESYDLTKLANAEGPVGDGEWRDLGDGTWQSPRGSRWREDTATVQAVIAKRAQAAQ